MNNPLHSTYPFLPRQRWWLMTRDYVFDDDLSSPPAARTCAPTTRACMDPYRHRHRRRRH